MKTSDIQNYIEKIITILGVEFESITDSVSDSGTLVFSIQSKDSKFLIGRDGEVLKSLNYLVKKYIEKNSNPETNQHILVDVNGYQEEKIKRVKTIAHMMAERCRFFKSPVELDPMNPFDRHVVHEYIQEQDDLETESTGFGKERRVIIKYKK